MWVLLDYILFLGVLTVVTLLMTVMDALKCRLGLSMSGLTAYRGLSCGVVYVVGVSSVVAFVRIVVTVLFMSRWRVVGAARCGTLWLEHVCRCFRSDLL